MKNCLVILGFVCSVILAAHAQEGLAIQKLTCPEYPELARHARVEGDVHLIVVLGTDGTVKSLRAINGPKILSDSAAKNVMTWRYISQGSEREIAVIYRYRLEGARTRDRESSQVTLQSSTLIEILSRPPLTIEDKITIPKSKKTP
jgi:hypothetical protein